MSTLVPPEFLLTTTNTITVVTGAYALVIDKKTGKIIKVVPEHPILRKNLEVLGGAVASLNAAEAVKGLEELRTQSAKLVASSVSAVETIVNQEVSAGVATPAVAK